MQIKNINPFERYVDKAILLVGAAFFVYLAWINLVKDPNSVPLPDSAGVKVAPGEVGHKITVAVHQLQNQIRHPANPSPGVAHVPNLVKGIADGQVRPLSTVVTALPPIAIGPLNQPVANINTVVVRGKTFYAPVVPSLTDMKIKQGRGVAILADNSNQPVNPNTPAAPVTKDVAWVKLSADFPVSDWLASLQGPAVAKPGFAALPPSFQRTTFYRVQVQRQTLGTDGRWSGWEKIHGFYLNPLPPAPMVGQDAAGRVQILSNLDAAASNILEPAFYPLEQIRLRLPPPKPANQQNPIPRGNIPGGGVFPPGFPGGAPGGFNGGGAGGGRFNVPRIIRQPVRQNVVANQPTNVTIPGGFPGGFPGAFPGNFPGVAGAGGVAGQPQTISSLLAEKSFPIWLRDTDVVPGATYRYRMRLALYNPTYLFPYKSDNPAIKNKPWIYSPWTMVSRPLTVRNRLYFFLDGGGGLVNGKAEFRIFKWVHGMWTYTTQYVSPGQDIGDVRPTSIISATTGRLMFKSVNFFTGYRLVAADVRAGGNNISAVVEDSHNNLSVRRSAWDAASPLEARLLRRVNQTGRPAAATAATP